MNSPELLRNADRNALPRVDVVIPTFKRSNLLGRAIRSVLIQTYPNIFITVVDDNDPGSKERAETANTIEEYKNEGNLAYLPHDLRRNGSAARNTGLNSLPNASDYVAFLDDDDEFAPTRIERLVSLLESKPERYGCAVSDWIGPDGRRGPVRSVNDSENKVADYVLGRYIPGNASNFFFRTKVIRNLGGFDDRFTRLQDIELFTRYLEKYHVARVPDTLLTLHEDGHRNTPTPEKSAENFAFFLTTFDRQLRELGILADVHRHYALVTLNQFLSKRDLRNARRYMTQAKKLGGLGFSEWILIIARYVAGSNRFMMAPLRSLNYSYKRMLN